MKLSRFGMTDSRKHLKRGDEDDFKTEFVCVACMCFRNDCNLGFSMVRFLKVVK